MKKKKTLVGFELAKKLTIPQQNSETGAMV